MISELHRRWEPTTPSSRWTPLTRPERHQRLQLGQSRSRRLRGLRRLGFWSSRQRLGPCGRAGSSAWRLLILQLLELGGLFASVGIGTRYCPQPCAAKSRCTTAAGADSASRSWTSILTGAGAAMACRSGNSASSLLDSGLGMHQTTLLSKPLSSRLWLQGDLQEVFRRLLRWRASLLAGS